MEGGSGPATGGQGPRRGLLWGLIIAVVVLTAGVAACSGEEAVTVPDLVGMELADAEEALSDIDLELGDVERLTVDASSERVGTVLSQQPSPGAEVDSGTQVALVVAEDPEEETSEGAEAQTPSAGSGSGSGSGAKPTSTPDPQSKPVWHTLAAASGTGDYIGAWFETTGPPLQLNVTVSSSSGDYIHFTKEPQQGSWQTYVLNIDLDYTLPPLEQTHRHENLRPGIYRIRVTTVPGDIEWSFELREYAGWQPAPLN